jgi:sulfur-carrier protein
MKVRVTLFGALRDADPRGFVDVDVPDASTIETLRETLRTHIRQHAPSISENLIKRSAFASEDEILHNHRHVPAHGQVAVLPPVSGG